MANSEILFLISVLVLAVLTGLVSYRASRFDRLLRSLVVVSGVALALQGAAGKVAAQASPPTGKGKAKPTPTATAPARTAPTPTLPSVETNDDAVAAYNDKVRTCAAIVSAGMASISALTAITAASFAIRTLRLNDRKLRSDTTIKIIDWYIKLEDERMELRCNGNATKERVEYWYLKHVRFLLYEHQLYKKHLIDHDVYESWIRHDVERAKCINNGDDFIPYKVGKRAMYIYYREGIETASALPEFREANGSESKFQKEIKERCAEADRAIKASKTAKAGEAQTSFPPASP